MNHQEYIKQYAVLPTGMSMDDENARHFQLIIEYMGNKSTEKGGGYRITNLGDEMSTKGVLAEQNSAQEYLSSDYRWETFEETLESARKFADTVRLFGLNYSQWKARRSAGENKKL